MNILLKFLIRKTLSVCSENAELIKKLCSTLKEVIGAYLKT